MWWPETGSNRRRRPFQGRALPLSYLAFRERKQPHARRARSHCVSTHRLKEENSHAEDVHLRAVENDSASIARVGRKLKRLRGDVFTFCRLRPSYPARCYRYPQLL